MSSLSVLKCLTIKQMLGLLKREGINKNLNNKLYSKNE